MEERHYETAAAFRTALVDAGLLRVVGVEGVYHRSGGFEDVVRGVERYLDGLRPVPDRRYFPPVLPRADWLRTDYLRSFPDLVGSVDVFSGDDRDHRELLARLDEGADWTDALIPAEVVLSSSVCHGLYGTLEAEVPADGLLVACSGYSFRHEPSLDPARQLAFRMHEVVRVGTPAQALDHRAEWVELSRSALEGLGLPVRVEEANDPFFGRAGRMLAAHQRAGSLKHELVLDLTAERGTALASVNLHEDHFGAPFGLSTADGAPAHTACAGFGLERVALGLFAAHGLTLDAWPASVRDRLGC